MKGIQKGKILDVIQFQFSIFWEDGSTYPMIVARFSDTQIDFATGGWGEKQRNIPVPNGLPTDNIDQLVDKVVANGITMIGQLNVEGEEEFFDLTNAVEI